MVRHTVIGACLASFMAACALDTHAVSPVADAGGLPDSAPDARLDASRDTRPPGSDASGDSSRTDTGAPDDSGVLADTGVDSATDAGCPDRDSDGTCDDIDPCPDDAEDDSDGDGVCDTDDRCPGMDDRVDVDGDGEPDGCDPCPIDGPAAPGVPTSPSGSGITISSVSLNGGGNIAIVTPGASVSVSLDYRITDCGCTGCIDQIEIGIAPEPEFRYCAYSGQPRCSGQSGSDTGTLVAPTTPGVHWIRFGKAQNFDCTHTGWWGGVPPDTRTLGALCVR